MEEGEDDKLRFRLGGDATASLESDTPPRRSTEDLRLTPTAPTPDTGFDIDNDETEELQEGAGGDGTAEGGPSGVEGTRSSSADANTTGCRTVKCKHGLAEISDALSLLDSPNASPSAAASPAKQRGRMRVSEKALSSGRRATQDAEGLLKFSGAELAARGKCCAHRNRCCICWDEK